jgi:cell division protein FtsX
VAAGLVLPVRLTGRSSDGTAVPAAAPATDAGRFGGFWFGKTDASVYLKLQVTPAQRDAIRKRLKSLDVVDAVFYESRAEAYSRWRELYRTKPGVVANTDPAALPESFRVRLDAPEHFKQLQRALCTRPPKKELGYAPCMDGVEVVIEDKAILKPVLVPKPWATSSDVTVFLPDGAADAQREAVRARLEAIDGVAKVTYETPAEAYSRLPEKLRRDGRDPTKVTPLFSPETVPAAFHVTLDEPVQTGEFHRALCGSRKTGACAGGLVLLEHSRK